MKVFLDFDIVEPPPPECLGLLWPISPNTHFQRTLKVSNDENRDLCLTALNSTQQAYFRPHLLGASLPEIHYQIELDTFAPSKEHFTLNETTHLALTEDVYECINRILQGPGQNPEQFLRKVISALASHFFYAHHDDELNRAELVCTHLQGDCLDINTVLMKILKTQSICSAYYIGIYSEAPQYPTQDDWHCWVSTNLNKVQDWDIAHHIKRGITPVQPALNPVDGIRCALSHGRGSQFLLGEAVYDFSHLGSPYWCLADRSVRQAAFQARLNTFTPALEGIC